MIKKQLVLSAAEYVSGAAENRIDASVAIEPRLAGLRMFEEPVFGFGDAADPMFETLRSPEALGDCFMLPVEWLPGAKSVISFFLPFTDRVKSSNKMDAEEPSGEWLHGRIEGQAFINRFCSFVADYLRNEGYEAVIPSCDQRFEHYKHRNGLAYTSNWSERHAAFICGLGTFGLSKGLITEKGTAGRFGSVITTAPYEPEARKYTDIYEYCSMCGACAKNCPVRAISLETGKDHFICSDFLNATKKKYNPRYGCGKCQVGVPCQNGIPCKNT